MADEQNTLVLNLDSGGDVVIRLRPDLAPQHVARIRELAAEGFYDGVVFHRVIPGFMAQGGDPTGSGMEHVDALPKGEPPSNPGKIVKAEIRPAS